MKTKMEDKIKELEKKIEILSNFASMDTLTFAEIEGEIKNLKTRINILEKRKTVITKVIDELHGMTGIFRIIRVDASEFKEGQKVRVTIEEIKE